MGIDKKFGEGKITIRNRQFIDTGTNAAMSMSDLGKGDPKIAEFFPEGTETFAVVCEGTDAKQKIDKGKYGCGTAVKFACAGARALPVSALVKTK
jgi:hypothetical protein